MTWGHSLNGGPDHIGLCPECGKFNGDCTDGLCDECFEMQPVKCSGCGDHFAPEEMNGSVCKGCADYEKVEKDQIFNEQFK